MKDTFSITDDTEEWRNIRLTAIRNIDYIRISNPGCANDLTKILSTLTDLQKERFKLIAELNRHQSTKNEMKLDELTKKFETVATFFQQKLFQIKLISIKC